MSLGNGTVVLISFPIKPLEKQAPAPSGSGAFCEFNVFQRLENPFICLPSSLYTYQYL